MAKVATKELSVNAASLLENVTRSRKQAQEALGMLKRMSDDLSRAEREKKEAMEREELRMQYEAAVKSMNNAYSSDQPKQPENAPAEEPSAPQAEKAQPVREEAPVETAPKAESAPVQAEAKSAEESKPAAAQQPRAPKAADAVKPRPAAAQPQPRPAAGQQPRPVNPQQGGAQAPRGPYGRPAGQAGAPGAPRPAGQRPPMGGPRPGGFAPRRPAAPELTPSVEKERVSNYDPNKKQYVRQVDPEHNAAKNKRQQTRSAAPSVQMDDDFVRGGKRKRKVAVQAPKPEPVKIEKAVMTAEKITVKDLSERIGKPVSEIIKKLLMLGIFANINNELDFDTAQLICTEFGVELELKLAETAEDALEAEDVEDSEEDLVSRPPVVTIMGHVDHGKTSLLDAIRNTSVTSTEAGGITQHIGAYRVEINGSKITFLDTPGHAAFTSMRLRGAMATDIAILVVAADDGIMPQTVEAINHAKAAGVQIIVAINKMDKPAANPDRVLQQLTEYELVPEEWGGETICVPVSAVTKQGIDKLLESVLLVAEMQELKANPNRSAKGVVIEARLDKGRGPVSTLLVQNGTLRSGDIIVAGTAVGRVRVMTDDKGRKVDSAGPSVPVEIMGLDEVPQAGDGFDAVNDERLARELVEQRKAKAKEEQFKEYQKVTLDNLFASIKEGELKDLNIIIKADVQGSAEAVKQSLLKLSNDEVRVKVIHSGVGAISESDVMLANASNAIIVGFNVRPDAVAADNAERDGVEIRTYRVIYDCIEEIEAAIKGMLAPKFRDVDIGRAEVRQVVRISSVGNIAGCHVMNGKITRNAKIRVVRDGIVVAEDEMASLRRFKDDVKEVASGFDCGIGLAKFNDIKEGDILEAFVVEEYRD